MQVKVLFDGKYNNARGKAQKLSSGDLLNTSEWYAKQLVSDGLAEISKMPEILESEPEEKKLAPGQDTESISVADAGSLDDLRDLPKKGVSVESFDEQGERVDLSEIVPGLSASMADVLKQNGFYNVPLLAEATEEQILAVPGVGAGTWRKIKSWQDSLEAE